MAVANQTIQDSRYRTIIKTLSSSTTSAGEIVDCSDLVGFQTGGLLTIAKVSWSLSSQVDILWDATSNVIALSLNGNGTMVLCQVNLPFLIMLPQQTEREMCSLLLALRVLVM